MNQIILKVQEIPQQYVGKGRAIIDPKIIHENKWQSGQIFEILFDKKTHVKLWPASDCPYGSGLIRIDGVTRQNIGAGIGDKVSIKPVDAVQAKQITMSSTEKIHVDNLHEYMTHNYLNHVFIQGDTVLLNTQLGRKIQFVITSTGTTRPATVTTDTVFKLGSTTTTAKSSIPSITYDDLGGLTNEVQKIREMVELPMRHPEIFEKIGVDAPKGVLLYGPPGTGKTLLAKAVAGETSANFISINGPEIMGKYYGQSEKRIREIFKQAQQNAPSIIFIDEIDSIAPKRDEVTGEVEKRIVSQLLALMDGIESRGKVVVIAATNRPDSIDPALRRPGRFDREIEIGVPDEAGRRDILCIHTRGMPIDQHVDVNQIAKTTHGFVGADLEMLSKEAAMRSLRRILPDIDLDQDKVPPESLQKIKITKDDFRDALKESRPSALREVFVQVPNVTWDDVGGLDLLKTQLKESIQWPIKYKEAFGYAGVRTPKGILLHGPPGTGKTLIAKAVAKMTDSNFISIKGPELLSKWVGESEKGIREIFRKARQVAPCIIFFDEIDSLIPRRDGGADYHVTQNMVSQILTEIDGLEELHDVMIIGATNRLDILDPAVLRPGRFDHIINVPKPDRDNRRRIFEIHTRTKPLAGNVDLVKLAEMTKGFSGADIESVTNNAALASLRRHIKGGSQNIKEIKITQEDLIKSINPVSEIEILTANTKPN